MVSSLKSQLYSFTDSEKIKCYIPEDLADDLTSTNRGDSWIHSGYTEPRNHALMHHMVSKASWALSTLDNGQLKWNKLACEEFMCKAARIVELIAALTHIGAGPPCRGTEQMADQISNGIQPRSLYLSFGNLLTIRRRTKTTHAVGVDAFSVCYYPKVLTDLITYYLLVIRPLERVVAEVLYGADAAGLYDIYLYVQHGSQMSSAMFSTALEKLTMEHMGVSLSLNPLRHIMIAFQRAYVKESRISQGDNIGDILSNHTSKTAELIYASEAGLLEGITANYLLDVQEWCDTYHDAIGLGVRKGPLIPLRIQRKHAHELGGFLYSTSDHKFNGPIQLLLQEIQDVAFKAAVQQLEPFIQHVIENSFAETCTKILTNMASESHLHHLSNPPSNHPIQTSQPPPFTLHTPPYSTSTTSPPIQPPQPPPFNLHNLPSHSTSTAPPIQPSQPPPIQPPYLLAEPEVTMAQNRKRSLTQVDHGPNAKREVSQNKKRNIPIDSHKRQDLQHIATSFHKPLNQADLLSKLPGDQPQAANMGVPGSSTAIPVYQKDAIGSTNQFGLEMETLTRQNPQEAESHNTLPEPPSPTNNGSQFVKAHQLALHGLRIVLQNKNACFQSKEQEELVTAVLCGGHTVAILPTGGGKSMAFTIPPIVYGRLTIAVIPFKSIITQVLRDANHRGIKAERWTVNTDRGIRETRLAVMGVETIIQDPFLK